MRWYSELGRRTARTLAAAGALAACVSIQPAAAQTVETLAIGPGFAALIPARGYGAGIAEPAGPVVVVYADGIRRLLVRRGDDLALADPPEAAETETAPDLLPADALPDGIVTHGRENIRRAWLTGPTGRYDHGILGDAVEASGLALERFDGVVFRYGLDAGSVFEDRLVRLADLDRDGWDEAIVVQSYLDAGAALAVFALDAEAVGFVAEVPPIGTPHRWLNPAGVADYDGDGAVEIAYVETPHIGGALKLYEFRDRRLVADHAVPGFSNHAIGTREQFLSATLDWDGDGTVDLAVPDARRRALRVMSFAGGTVRELARVPHDAPIATAILVTAFGEGGAETIVYGLADGTLVAVAP